MIWLRTRLILNFQKLNISYSKFIILKINVAFFQQILLVFKIIVARKNLCLIIVNFPFTKNCLSFTLNRKIILYFFNNCLIVFNCLNYHWFRHILVCFSIETLKFFFSNLLFSLRPFSVFLALKRLMYIFFKLKFLFFFMLFSEWIIRIILLNIIFIFFIFRLFFFKKYTHFIRPKNFHTNQNRSSFFSLKNSCLFRRYMKDTIISCWISYKR